MAKANNSGRTKKSHNYKPYDTSNSFVKRLTAKVSEILPQSSSWVSKLFSPAPKLNVREREELEEDEEEEEERQPPSKRLCFRPPEANDYTHRNNINRLCDLDRESGEISPITNSRLNDERAVPGPSGLHLRNFVSSTPAVRQVVVESSPKVAPILVKRTPVAELKKNANKRSSLNLSSSSTLNSPSQPSFDTFVFKNPLNKSGLRPRSSLNESCFYPGETTYGGSSSRISMPVLDQPKARVVNVTASPSLQRDTIGTSALRILKALEQFSTPVLDAKKIPVRTEGNPRKRKPPQPYEELIFPSMPELLSLKRREVVSKPSTSTEKAKPEQQPTPSISADVPTTIALSVPLVPQQPTSVAASCTEYSLRPESTKETHIGSIKGRQKDVDIETERVPELNLPNVELKITSLPKFDLGNASQEVKPLPPKSKPETILPCSAEYKFSEPEILEKVSKEKIIPDFHVNIFKFSEPLVSLEFNEKTTATPPSISPSRPSSENVKELKMKVTPTNFKLKRKSVESSKPDIVNIALKMPTEMKTSSIMEVFSKNTTSPENKLKPSENNLLLCSKCKANYDKNKGKCHCENKPESKKQFDKKKSEAKWECKKCQGKNESCEIKCKHCSSGKGSESTVGIHKGFEGFKKPADTWECKECFVRNKNSSDACVACSVSKSGKSSSVDAQTTSASSIFAFSSGGNKTEVVTKTSKNFVPLVNSIKKPQGTWECNTCLVQNKVDALSCVACSTPKPGSAPVEKSKPAFSFGIPATTVETNSFQFGISTNAQKNESTNDKQAQFSFGSSNNNDVKNSLFKFEETDKKNESSPISTAPQIANYIKNSKDKWECNTCLIQNKIDVNSCIACGTTKPGSNAVEKPKPTFSFGMPSTNLSTVNSVQFGSNLNTKKIEATTVQNPFAFDHQLSEKKSTNSSLFKFGSSDSKTNNESKNLFAFMNSEKPKENELPNTAVSNLFSFGSNAKENKLDNANADDNPPKKRVSFGKPNFINENTSTIFGNVTSSKSNDISSSKFNFTANSLFENNSTTSKEPTKESSANAFTFGNAESNTNLKPTICEPAKSVGFNAAPTETASLTNNDHSNLQRIFGGSFKGPELENKPFSFMGNSQGSQNNQFTFNSAASTPSESFGNQQPASGLPLFSQQQQAPAPSMFNQQSEFSFGHPQQQQTQSLFSFTASPAQGAGIGGSTPAFGGFAPPSNPAAVFDPNVKPSFNFTGGATPSFSAAPTLNSGGEVSEKRKVRKAIRRTTQHR